MDGVRVADTRDDLLDGSLFTPIAMDEHGSYVTPTPVWTGTGVIGAKDGQACSNWVSSNKSLTGLFGSAHLSGSLWTAHGSHKCDTITTSIYCFED